MSFFPSSKNTQAFWEVMTGLLLIIIALLIAAAAFSSFRGNIGRTYPLNAIFSRVDGLETGSEVRLAGVKVGTVEKLFIDPKNWQAHAALALEKDIKLPIDSNAIITSDSLLGGKYIALMPGGEPQILKPNDVLTDTQGTISLEELITKFVFSSTSKDKAGTENHPASLS